MPPDRESQMRFNRFLVSFIILCTFSFNPGASAIPAEGRSIMIAAVNPHAVEAGRKVAARGGNVVDVAIAVGLTLSVTSPYFAALGGGGFAMVKMDGQTVDALDFREVAPSISTRDQFVKLDKTASVTGGKSVGIPGIPAGYLALHKKYGKLKWESLFTEALSLARNGLPISGEWVEYTRDEQARFNKTGLDTFFKPGGISHQPGEILKQPGLADALIALRDKKVNGFYSGKVAADLVEAVKSSGGTMSLADLKNYKVRWLSPLTTDFAGHKVYLMPPPSSGGVLLFQALKLIEKLNLKKTRPLSVDEYHLLGEIESRVFLSRNFLADPDFHKNPISYFTSEPYILDLAKTIDPRKTVALKPLKGEEIYGKGHESTETTHFSVMDTQGHAIAMTVTMNGAYGSGVVSPRYRIALNDTMDDFTTRPGETNQFGLTQGESNIVEPGKRPLSSMSPTLVDYQGKTVIALGGQGGPAIITGVLQVLHNLIDRGFDADTAIQMPRVHHQFLPNVLLIDKGRVAPEVQDGLKSRGYQLKESLFNKVYVVRLRPDGILEGAFDSRGEGGSGGI